MVDALRILESEFPGWRLTIYLDKRGSEVLVATEAATGIMLTSRWTWSGWSVFTQFGSSIAASPSLVKAFRAAMT